MTLNGTVTSLTTAQGIERVDIPEAGPGEIVAVAGLPEVTIGDTLTDPADPRPLPRLDVDEPTLRMTFGVNTSPLSGREGKFLTSRQIRARLDREVLGNVSIEVLPDRLRRRPSRCAAGASCSWRCSSSRCGARASSSRCRGRRCCCARSTAKSHEPYERITIDIPPDFIGTVSAVAGRRGRARMEQMTTDADGRVRMEFIIPTRGLVGYRGQLLTETRGTGAAAPDRRGLRAVGGGGRPTGHPACWSGTGRASPTRTACSTSRSAAQLFIGAGVEVYEGMIIGENTPAGDMDVNPTKEKKLTNIRTHRHDESLRLTPPPPMTLESAIEFIAADELVEVTPMTLRLRKRLLAQHDRRREAGREYDQRRAAERAAEQSSQR